MMRFNRSKLNAQHKILYFIFTSFLLSFGSFAEEVKVVTYYPAPYSEYKELNTTQNTSLATASGNVGIGKSAVNATEKLDVVGNVSFSGALMPSGSAGTSGQVLTSQGTNTAPEWGNRSHSTVYFRDPSGTPFVTMNPPIIANTFIFQSTTGGGNVPKVTIADLKTKYPIMAAETRTIIGVIFDYNLYFYTTKSANWSKPLTLQMCKETRSSGAYECDNNYFQSPPNGSTFQMVYGNFTEIDHNANGIFDSSYHFFIMFQNGTGTFTADPGGTVQLKLHVAGYITGD